MPEGPSLVILRGESSRFVGKTIATAQGNTRAIDPERLAGQKIVSMRTFGKQFLIELPSLAIRIHFLLFGSYRIDERKPGRVPRLSLGFADGSELNFYACSVREIGKDLDAAYDWSADVMSPSWDAARARKKLRAAPDMLACDALLDQDIFAGVGNIIKNEVLFRIRLHPLSTIGAMPAPKLRALVEQAREYSFDFLEWKKKYQLKKHWLAHAKAICPRCNIKFSKAVLGRAKRRSFYCDRCQKRYS
ncbi:DNA-formamidopyrimidine glycosylase family protein [Massilia sp. GCM10020059]|uniref:Endonuclease n=1 Tax=Massilia agrisoli TaxID=2892444 RepID=A0ABS8IMZ6_9BURK|nr:DNA-formamidopyrimidine glycosylase family protein [Massilia agrisoli]MCC6069518.1 endonuclease [Massilia agrisoli]